MVACGGGVSDAHDGSLSVMVFRCGVLGCKVLLSADYYTDDRAGLKTLQPPLALDADGLPLLFSPATTALGVQLCDEEWRAGQDDDMLTDAMQHFHSLWAEDLARVRQWLERLVQYGAAEVADVATVLLWMSADSEERVLSVRTGGLGDSDDEDGGFGGLFSERSEGSHGEGREEGGSEGADTDGGAGDSEPPSLEPDPVTPGQQYGLVAASSSEEDSESESDEEEVEGEDPLERVVAAVAADVPQTDNTAAQLLVRLLRPYQAALVGGLDVHDPNESRATPFLISDVSHSSLSALLTVCYQEETTMEGRVVRGGFGAVHARVYKNDPTKRCVIKLVVCPVVHAQ